MVAEWISIDGRLPITEDNMDGNFMAFDVLTFDGITVECSEIQAGNTIGFWTEFDRTDVTHWMPLPEPPK